MKTIALATTNDRTYTLCAIVYPNDKVKEYVVAFLYDATKPYGNQWAHGHYYQNLEDAMDVFNSYRGKIPYYRLEEICTNALHWIEDNYDDLMEFDNNYDIDFSINELLYFGLDKYL